MNEAFEWWERNTPTSIKNYGPPVLSNGDVNHEMLAAGLGELPFGLVYSGAEESFWYSDYALGGHCKTTAGKVEILYKNIVLKAAEETTLPVRNTLLGLRDHSKKVVSAAKVILEVDPLYWNTHERIVDGTLERSPREGIDGFVSEFVTKEEESELPVGLGYKAYSIYCQQIGCKPLPKMRFIKEATAAITTQYGCRMRNDLRDETGKITRGWKRITLKQQIPRLCEC